MRPTRGVFYTRKGLKGTSIGFSCCSLRLSFWLESFNSPTTNQCRINIFTQVMELLVKRKKRLMQFSVELTQFSFPGLISAILLLISLVNGTLAYFPFALRQFVKPIHLKLLHNIIGIASFVMGLATLFLGVFQYLHRDVHYTLMPPVAITSILTLIGPLTSAVNFVKTLF